MPIRQDGSNSKLLSPVVLGAGDQKSALGVPQQSVQLRVYKKIHLHFWNIAEDHKTLLVDKGATNELINSADARIAFRDPGGHVQAADFSPVSLNRDALTKAWGSVFKCASALEFQFIQNSDSCAVPGPLHAAPFVERSIIRF
jgi:hypothetical protein